MKLKTIFLNFILTSFLLTNITFAQDPSITVLPSSGFPFQLITISWNDFPANPGDELQFYFGNFALNYPDHNPIFGIEATESGSIEAIAPGVNFVLGETYQIMVQEFKSDGSALFTDTGDHVYASVDFKTALSDATATASKSTANQGDTITISWNNFPGNPYNYIDIVWDDPLRVIYPEEGRVEASSSGSADIEIPSDASPGEHTITVNEFCAPACGGFVDSTGVPIYASKISSNIRDSGEVISFSSHDKIVSLDVGGALVRTEIPITVIASEVPTTTETTQPPTEQQETLDLDNSYLLMGIGIIIVILLVVVFIFVRR